MSLQFDVIVIGGGHAGVEAAWACANLIESSQNRGGRVALVTLDASKIGVMSCNPAIGGLAKGQLVREIDALGGLMGLATDATGIQFRVLNTSRGPAVRGPRAQCDKHAYASIVQRMIASRSSIDVIEGSVDDLLIDGDRVTGVRVVNARHARLNTEPQPTFRGAEVCESGDFVASAVVLTTGTFMRGLMHTGEDKREGGRYGEAAAVGISGALQRLGFELGRLKTGTPPRLRKGTIKWESLAPQYGDEEPWPFSDLTGTLPASRDDAFPSLAVFPAIPQVECRQTRTNSACHELIRANLHRAPMFSGQIEGVGPRYCPSIEDKVVRFADRDEHGVFLEPESLSDDWIYCNGISTSLPRDVQDVIIRSMPGCEHAEILRYGYAVEYDMVRPHQIHATGMTKRLRGLFLAGQINGTSGYEEAAAQGLVAGVNAMRLVCGLPEVIFGREQAYIGVLMDDLITKTPVEPYRMFTSRAEHRLMLRSDNAADRLTPLAEQLGLLGTDLGVARLAQLRKKVAAMETLHAAIESTTLGNEPLAKLIRADVFDLDQLRSSLPDHPFDRAAWMTALADRRYEAYIVRQRAEIKRQAELEHRRLPQHVDYMSLPNMRTEAKQSLHKFRPSTFGQASRLEGITPADITILAVLLRSRS